mmetsp:Transcript_35423/g.46641  ORF Transcript_35423/g.46641 Transcript_35423/m.46641 type:complete len:110 (+) Transcript_35423:149-478(+)
MPPKYVAFTIKYKKFWLGLSLFNILSSGVMAWAGVRIMGSEHDQTTMSYQECISMKVVLWMWFGLHIFNMIYSLMALCGLEKKLCIGYVLMSLAIFDGIVLIWSQVTYF